MSCYDKDYNLPPALFYNIHITRNMVKGTRIILWNYVNFCMVIKVEACNMLCLQFKFQDAIEIACTCKVPVNRFSCTK